MELWLSVEVGKKISQRGGRGFQKFVLDLRSAAFIFFLTPYYETRGFGGGRITPKFFLSVEIKKEKGPGNVARGRNF